MITDVNEPMITQSQSATIKAFLDSETEKLSTSAKERVDLFLSTLDFSTARFFQKDESEKIYYVPPKNNSPLNQALIIYCNEDGTYRRASRLRYSFGSNRKFTDFSEKDFYSLFANEINSKKGTYTFSTLDDLFLNRIVVDQKGNFAYGSLKRKDKQPKNSLNSESNCIDWYLVTTVTYSDGTVQTYEDFLFTTCDGCPINASMKSVCDGGGGAVGGYDPPGEPQPVSKAKNWTVYIGPYNFYEIKSDDILNGLKPPPPYFGHFTSVNHIGSSVFNHVTHPDYPNNPNPYSTYTELASNTTIEGGGGVATSYVKGKLTLFDNTNIETTKTGVWMFVSEF